MKFKKYGIYYGIAALVLLALGGSIWSIFGKNDAGSADQPMTLDKDGKPIPGQTAYMTQRLFAQEPISIDGQASLEHDYAYYYDASMGEVATINVVDGQLVQKGDTLITYRSKGEVTEQLEDAQRQQTRLYNQRQSLIDQLSEMTGQIYNYQGDLVQGYWAEDGNKYYYVAETIGKGGQQVGQAVTAEQVEQAEQGGAGDGAEGIKEQIRKLNQDIEDTEISITRLVAKQNGKIVAKYDGKVIVNQAGVDDTQVPIVRIISDQILVKGSVGEYDFHMLAEDQPVKIHVNAEDRDIGGTMVDYDRYPPTASPAPSRDSQASGGGSYGNGGIFSTGSSGGGSGPQYGFVIHPEEAIQPGFTVKIQLSAPGLVIPSDAIIEENGKKFVFLYQDGVARKHAVELTRQGTKQVALNGFKEGDQVILNPIGLTDGMEVQINDMMAPGEMGDVGGPDQGGGQIEIKAN